MIKIEKIKKIVGKNKPFSIGILAVVIFVSILIPIIIIYNVDETPKTYYATHDMNINGVTNDPLASNTKITYDSTRLSFGSSQTGTANPSRKGFIMRFNLDKPSNWKMCEISIYMYGDGNGASTTALVYLFAGNWTEEDWDGYGNYMDDFEIYWYIIDSVGSISNNGLGFRRVDITEYINGITTETFSIVVYPRRLENYDCGGYFYSSEWDGTDPLFPYVLPESDSYKNYLPQLIWS